MGTFYFFLLAVGLFMGHSLNVHGGKIIVDTIVHWGFRYGLNECVEGSDMYWMGEHEMRNDLGLCVDLILCMLLMRDECFNQVMF